MYERTRISNVGTVNKSDAPIKLELLEIDPPLNCIIGIYLESGENFPSNCKIKEIWSFRVFWNHPGISVNITTAPNSTHNSLILCQLLFFSICPNKKLRIWWIHYGELIHRYIRNSEIELTEVRLWTLNTCLLNEFLFAIHFIVINYLSRWRIRPGVNSREHDSNPN